jgi:hypothetical protein
MDKRPHIGYCHLIGAKGSSSKKRKKKMEINESKLLQVTRSKYISFDAMWRLEFVSVSGGKGDWIISLQNKDDKYFSVIAHAPTFDQAREKYYSLVKALA